MMTGWFGAGAVVLDACGAGVARREAPVADACIRVNPNRNNDLALSMAAGAAYDADGKIREPRAESREPRAESREPRAESREPRAESREPRAESIVMSAGAFRAPVEHKRIQPAF